MFPYVVFPRILMIAYSGVLLHHRDPKADRKCGEQEH
jgi:hypothetical protein